MLNVCANDRYKKAIIVAGLIGIALIFLSGLLKGCNEEKSTVEIDNAADKYAQQLERSLTGIVSNIQGSGKTKVLVTIENSKEIVYATEEKKNTQATEDKSDGQTTKKKESDDVEKKYITVKGSDGTEKALAITEIQPAIKGVVVICEGGEDSVVAQRIINAVTTALHITSGRVFVTKMS